MLIRYNWFGWELWMWQKSRAGSYEQKYFYVTYVNPFAFATIIITIIKRQKMHNIFALLNYWATWLPLLAWDFLDSYDVLLFLFHQPSSEHEWRKEAGIVVVASRVRVVLLRSSTKQKIIISNQSITAAFFTVTGGQEERQANRATQEHCTLLYTHMLYIYTMMLLLGHCYAIFTREKKEGFLLLAIFSLIKKSYVPIR